jgi:uncharacterized protein (TIGR02996 family)
MANLRALQRISWLERARDAKSDAAVLMNLVGAWTAEPCSAVYELVRAASSRCKRKPDDSWFDVIRRHEPTDLDWVLDNLDIRNVDEAKGRAEELGDWPDDPRIAPALLRKLPRTPLRGRTSRPFWTIVFRHVHKRFHAGVAAAIAELDEVDLGGDFGEYVEMKLRTLRRRASELPEEPALDERTAALVTTLRAKLEIDATAEGKKSLEDFCREIWAAPLDDGMREVFADWLIARNDPRGELIMLQLTRKRRGLDTESQKREAALLREHARDWMGPLEPAIDRKQFRFEGGFVYACKVSGRGMTAALMTHPAWSTVREYVLDEKDERTCDAWLDHMIALGAKRR